MNLRQITNKDQIELKKIYFDAIKSINEIIYSKEHKMAWISQAWKNPNFKESFNKGKGWLIEGEGIILAFAIRYPTNRISLLYCKGNSQKKGYGTRLINKLEEEAKREGLHYLYTEASLISYGLFLKYDWEIIRKEKVIINNKYFVRYKMKKNLNNLVNKI